jgi:ribonucleoside-diphosphate reductase alpha chain
MLLAFGIKSKLYENRRGGHFKAMLPDGKGGLHEYPVKEMHSLRVSRSSRRIFEHAIGFDPASHKAAALAALNACIESYADRLTDEVGSVTPAGTADVFDLTESTTHHFAANGLLVHNCSEFSFLNDTSCNLASLNLMKFVREDGEFDVEAFRYAARLTITAQEILVDNAGYPTQKITDNSHLFRPLGLGYANLGALLMSRGLAYDSPDGHAYAGAITAIMTAEAYRQSAIIARDHGGPFAEYKKNEEPFLRVIEKHCDAAHSIPEKSVPADMRHAARNIWAETLQLGRDFGFRNAQTSLLAPTGTIAFMMDCDTTGIEPDIALVKYKKLVGEGFLKIVNNTVPGALRKLGYSAAQVDAIVAYVNERETIEGAPELKPEHLSVFDCAFKPMNGTRSIHYMGHLRMMSAVQPFLSGAISKTVNMPEAATPAEIESVYLEGWKMGLKAIAIYRDNSKRSQPLSTGKKKQSDAGASLADATALAAPAAAAIAAAEHKPYRRRLPAERQAITHKFDIAGHEGYITVGLYEDGQPGEIFLKMAKEGSTISGLMDTFATTVSVALQYGVPLHDLVFKFAHVRFEPSGFTSNPEIPIAKSIVDYIFRWLGSRFLPPSDRAALGLVDRSATAESSTQPLSFGFGGSAGIPGGAGTSGSGESPAAQPASGFSGATNASGAGVNVNAGGVDASSDSPEGPASSPATAVAAPGSEPSSQPPAKASAGSASSAGASPSSNGNGKPRMTLGNLGIGRNQVTFSAQADAPSCADCGSIMVRNGSCYKCLNCGSTSGCS